MLSKVFHRPFKKALDNGDYLWRAWPFSSYYSFSAGEALPIISMLRIADLLFIFLAFYRPSLLFYEFDNVDLTVEESLHNIKVMGAIFFIYIASNLMAKYRLFSVSRKRAPETKEFISKVFTKIEIYMRWYFVFLTFLVIFTFIYSVMKGLAARL